MPETSESGEKKTSGGLAVVFLLILSVLISFLVEEGHPSGPADYINAIVMGLFCFFFCLCPLLVLLERLAKSISAEFPVQYISRVLTGVLALYSVALLDSKRVPWSLWEIRETASRSERLKKIASYADDSACNNEAHRKLDEQMELYRAVGQRVNVHIVQIREGNTIFKFSQPLPKKLMGELKARAIAKLEKRRDLTEDEKQRMADEVYGPAIESTLSFVCLPTTRDKYWPAPFDTPKDSFVVAATFADIGEAELKARAKKLFVGRQ